MIVPAPRRRITAGSRQDHHRPDHHVEGMLLRRDVLVEQLAPLSEAGIVDQNFHGLFDAGEPIGHPLDIVPLPRSAGIVSTAGLIAVLEDRGRLRQPVGIARHEHEVVAACRIARANAAPIPDVPPVINAVAMRPPYA